MNDQMTEEVVKQVPDFNINEEEESHDDPYCGICDQVIESGQIMMQCQKCYLTFGDEQCFAHEECAEREGRIDPYIEEYTC